MENNDVQGLLSMQLEWKGLSVQLELKIKAQDADGRQPVVADAADATGNVADDVAGGAAAAAEAAEGALNAVEVIRRVAGDVGVARQWYAVYRALADAGAVSVGDYDTFCRWVAEAVPDHPHMPVRDELQRMAVLSFARPVAQWNPTNAPVRGKRFDDYLRLARAVALEIAKTKVS